MAGCYPQPRKMAAKEKGKRLKHRSAKPMSTSRHATMAVKVEKRHNSKVKAAKIHRTTTVVARHTAHVIQAPIVISKVEPTAVAPGISPAAVETKIPEVVAPVISAPLAAATLSSADTASPAGLLSQLPPGSYEIVTRLVNGKPVQMVRIRRSQLQKQSSTAKKLLFAAVPGFFGLMGLSQVYQGRKLSGLLFFLTGAIVSFLSSWYIIIPSRIDAALTHGSFLPAYALSLLSSTGMSASLASKLSMDLLGVVAVIWAVQLFDAMGPFFGRPSMATVTSASGSKISIPFPTLRRAIVSAPNTPFRSSSEVKSPADASATSINNAES